MKVFNFDQLFLDFALIGVILNAVQGFRLIQLEGVQI